MSLKHHPKFRIWTPLHLHQKLLRQHIEANAKQLMELLHLAFPGEDLRILDIGCGHKPYASSFASDKVQYLGADIPWTDVKPDFEINADTGDVHAPTGSFHAIVHFQTLEHVPDANALLRQSFQLLKPGGYLFCTVPFIFEYHPVPGDFRRWTGDGLKLDLQKAGFTVLNTSNVEADFPAFLTVVELFFAGRLGYKITKPLFLIMNLIGWLARNTRKSVFPLTVSALARTTTQPSP